MSYSTEKHQVFISFRGEDTRRTFTSHLYEALCKGPLKTFIDYDIKRGDDAWPALSKAIEQSRASIVVFSENYATSTWCLDELVKILECRKEHGQVVIPVFYNTDPSDVRKQTGTYKNAFDKYEGDPSNREKVSRWIAALKEAADISGQDSRNHRDDNQLIKNVVNDVLQKLEWMYPIELTGLVGTERICENVEPLLENFQRIGIWGMGGIGKTTIAKFLFAILFAKFFTQFDYVCFVDDAKEYSANKLMREILKEEISSSNFEGPIFGLRRLSGKKVLIVLDDMDNADALEQVSKEYANLTLQSKLIVTTRDRQLLVDRVDSIYEVKTWEKHESLQLFYSQAFKESCPREDYKDLSDRAVECAGGLPLALKVLGSNLRSKTDKRFWESTLRKLNNYNKTVQDLLKVSYSGLDDLEKEIILDIEFFLKGKNKDRAIRILDACNLEASSGIEVLKDKALITISTSNKIQMHDLLQQMGFGDSESHKVIANNKGTYSIKGIALDLSPVKDLPLSDDTFTRMISLRFLRLRAYWGRGTRSFSNTYLNLPKALGPFSEKLRYFEWVGYPFTSLPQPFHAKFLVEIHMPQSNVKELWQGTQELDHLDEIDLPECKQFVKLPDLSKAPRLRWVNLSGCESLLDIHPSVLSSDTLITLILDRCTKLTKVKGEKHLKSLEMISVNGCSNLKEFAVSSDLVENLDLSNTGIQTLDMSIGNLHNLKWLNLEGLRYENLLKELSLLTSLKRLKLSDPGLVIDEHRLQVLFDGIRSLEILHLKCCSNFFRLPGNMYVLSKLHELKLDGSNVKTLPKSIKDLDKLEILSLENCKELEFLPELPPSIRKLCAANCTSLVTVSNLKTLATKMRGVGRHISFKNCWKLDGHYIMGSLHLTMMSAAVHNVSVRMNYVRFHSCNYNGVDLCLPGSRVPRQIRNRTNESSITIELPNNHSNLLLVGFIYSLVLSPAGDVKKPATKIICNCHFANDTITKTTWLSADFTELSSDHAFVWYDPFHCDGILNYHEPKVGFQFCVADREGEVDGWIIKECGASLISASKLHKLLPKLDLDSNVREGLEEGLKRMIQNRMLDYEQCDFRKILNQPRDLSQLLSLVTVSESEIVKSDSSEEGDRRKDHTSGETDHSPACASEMTPDIVPETPIVPNATVVSQVPGSSLAVSEDQLLVMFENHYGNLEFSNPGPSLFCDIARTQFAAFLNVLQSYDPVEWFTVRRSELLMYLQTFERFGLKSDWLDALGQRLDEMMPSDQEIKDVTAARDLSSAQVQSLKERLVSLTQKVDEARNQLESEEAKLAELSSRLARLSELKTNLTTPLMF